MSARPSLVCPRCGDVDGLVHTITPSGVVFRCSCGHRFDVEPERPVGAPAGAAVGDGGTLGELTSELLAAVDADANRMALAFGALSVFVERAAGALRSAGLPAEAVELEEALAMARRVAYGPIEVVA